MIVSPCGAGNLCRVVQPWGPDKALQATLIREQPTAADAFAEIDRLAAQMMRTGAPPSNADCPKLRDDSQHPCRAMLAPAAAQRYFARRTRSKNAAARLAARR
jgi:hypothetical protein